MDVTKKFATPEACVHFLEGMQWQSLLVLRPCCCQVDNRAVYFRVNCAEIHVSPRFAAYTRLPSQKPFSKRGSPRNHREVQSSIDWRYYVPNPLCASQPRQSAPAEPGGGPFAGLGH